MPDTHPASDLEPLLDLFLHEIRSPVSVAQGYLRLLIENRLSDMADRERAIAQSALALDRIGDLCASAGEYLNAADTPSESSSYPAVELAKTFGARWEEKGLSVKGHERGILGDIRFLPSHGAAAAIVALLEAALRSDPVLTQAVHVGVHGNEVIFTTGDEAVREQLIGATPRAPFDAWRGGNGLRVALALKQLAHTNFRIWTLPEQPGAVAIAIPLELPE